MLVRKSMMNLRRMRRPLPLAAAALGVALTLSACGGGDPGGPDADGITTLTLSTFNDWGYTDELLQEYMDENPNIRIIHNRASSSNDARANYFQKLGKGGLADLEGVEVDWMPEVLKYSDLVVPVPADLTDRWLDWKVEAATDDEGNLVAYGVDIGPEGVCYRADLFEDAGLPSDRDEVAELLDGGWDKYFELGEEYVDATGDAFFDSAGATFQGMINQVPAAFENPETGEIVATTNPAVREAFDVVTEYSSSQSAHLSQWSDDWYAGLANGEFATMLCPGWMLGIIEGNAPQVDGWDMADAFPGGGGNWGGSYITIPAKGKNIEEAQKLAAWLTSPEIQIKAFENAGLFPSQVEALESETLLSMTDPYFNDAPTGQILTDRAEAVAVTPHKGPQYFKIMDLMQEALNRVEDGLESPDEAWDKWVKEVKSVRVR